MKAIWEALRFVLLAGGIVISLAVFGSGKMEYGAVFVGIVCALILICSLMMWRNTAGEYATQRHNEVIRALGAIYKATGYEN